MENDWTTIRWDKMASLTGASKNWTVGAGMPACWCKAPRSHMQLLPGYKRCWLQLAPAHVHSLPSLIRILSQVCLSLLCIPGMQPWYLSTFNTTAPTNELDPTNPPFSVVSVTTAPPSPSNSSSSAAAGAHSQHLLQLQLSSIVTSWPAASKLA